MKYIRLLLWMLLWPDVASANNMPFFVQANFVTLSSAVLLCTLPSLLGFNANYGVQKLKEKESTPHIEHVRRSICDLFLQLGISYVRRAYRMDETSFWRLCRIIRLYMIAKKPVSKGRGRRKKNGAKNGVIPSPLKLSAALCWFAGDSAYDIAVSHGIGHTDVFRAVWRVVDAVNKCPELAFNYPESHHKQRQIAAGFARKSKAGFTQCCGAIDGILIWMEKPSEKSRDQAKCGPKKFFCGRKKKFGLNLQGTVDHHGRFLHMAVWHPGATSDYLAFSTMDLYHKLERPGFLAPGLCLFGDNAYVNTPYMATPFKNVGSGSKDDYDFYHSQL